MRRSAVAVGGVAAGVGVLALGLTLAAAARAYLWAPYADPHGWLANLFAAEAAGHPWRAVWMSFNQQRIPLAILAQWADVELIRGRAPTFLLAGAAAELAGLAAVGTAIVRSRLSAMSTAALVVAAILVLANVALAEDLAFPVFTVYPFVAGFAAAAFASMSAAARSGRGGPAFWASLVAAALASAGNAAGLAVWPVLLFWAAVEGRDRRQQGLAWLAAVIVVGALEWGLGAPVGTGSGHAMSLAQAAKMARYFVGFAGLWWGSLTHPGFDRGFGLLVLLAGVGGLARRTGAGATAPVRRLGRMLVSFGLLTALLATVGRVDELAQPIVPTRYFPFAALLQLGALLCWTDRLEAAARPRPRIAAGAVALLTLGALGSQVKGGRSLVATAQVIRAGSRAFDAGDRSPAVTQLVDSHPEMDAAVRAELRRRGLPW